MQWYPLRFDPLFRRYIWGGRRLAQVLGKSLGDGDDYAESWELVDRREDQSRVLAGALAGRSLAELLAEDPGGLLGDQHAHHQRFPLLFKFLDANRDLSVQVHPNDAQAAQLKPPDLGKTEAWVILHAAPDSRVYAGLKRGFDRAALEREIQRGTCELCLHHFHPQAGDCLFIPAGVLHALGAGLLVAEIQQSSDTTFRVFDWNRVGTDGQPRPLHVEQALDVINYEYGPVQPQTPQPLEEASPGAAAAERLVACDKFVLDRRHVDAPFTVGDRRSCRLLVVLEGSVDVEGDPLQQPVVTGQTVLLPAALGTTHLAPRRHTTLLDISLPTQGSTRG